MKVKLFHHRMTDLLGQRNSLLFVGAGLLALNFTQALFTFSKSERIVVVPADVRQEFWVEKNQVSASYLEEMAIVFTDLILENSPKGAAYRRDIILRHTAASGFGALKSQLLEDEARLKKEHLSTSFHANSIKVNPGALAVEIKGDLMRYVGDKRISQSRDVYELVFEYHRGQLLLKSFKLIGSDKNDV
jgi:conjugal transfer pilus assembly protein TraE